MFKSLRVLFMSGILVRPMVLLGIAVGYFIVANISPQQYVGFFTQPRHYAYAMAIALAYTGLFNRALMPRGQDIDWNETALRGVLNFLKLVVASACSVVLFSVFL